MGNSLRRPRDWIRNYTVWRAQGGTIDLLVTAHEHGPGRRFVSQLDVGDQATVTGPLGGAHVNRDADWYLLAGDSTAAASFDALAATFPSDAPLVVIIDCVAPGDQLPLPELAGRADLDLTWVSSHGRYEQPQLVRELRNKALPAGRGSAYLAGEMGLIRSARDHLRQERGWPRSHVRLRPHWTLGRAGP